MRRALPLLVCLAALLAPGAVAADLHSRTLANGLRVIVKEDRRAPTVAHLVWYRGNYILGGGGFVSRLTRDLRDAHGYAYSVYSYFFPLARPGPFQIGLQTRRDQADAAIARVRTVVAEFLANGPTEAELRDAKASLIGGFPLRIDSNRKLLNEWALIGFYRLPERWLADFPARVERVTLADTRAAFARHVAPERFVAVVVGADKTE